MTLSTTTERVAWRKRILLLGTILVLHVYSMWAFGATFWYDSAHYLQFGFALMTRHGLTTFYDGPNYYIFQHLMPGLPLLLAATIRFFGRYGWLALTAMQHLVATCALLYFTNSYCHWLPLGWRLITIILICVHPYYMAFHNAPMTESLAGSLLLIGLGAALRLSGGGRVSKHTLLVLAGSGILAVQFRSYAALMVLGVLLVLFLFAASGTARIRMAYAGLAVAASLLFFPAYRWAVTGAFFMPNIDYVTLSIALGINPRPTDDAIRRLKELPLPSNMSAERISANGLTFQEAASVGAHLRSLDYSDRSARTIVKRMAWIVRTDSRGVIANQARLALFSVGAEHLALAGKQGDDLFYRGYTVEDFRRHVRYYLDWFSWTLFADYGPIFGQFFDMFGKTPETIDEHVRQELKRFLGPFFVTREPALRDPLRLLRVPFEMWIGGWLIGVILWSRKKRPIALILVLPVALNYVVSVSAPVGDLRYSQSLLPLYIAGSIWFLADATVWLRTHVEDRRWISGKGAA